MQVSEAAITGITKLFFDRVKSFLDRRGKQMHGGIIVDATIIDALSLTRMRKKARPGGYMENSAINRGNTIVYIDLYYVKFFFTI